MRRRRRIRSVIRLRPRRGEPLRPAPFRRAGPGVLRRGRGGGHRCDCRIGDPPRPGAGPLVAGRNPGVGRVVAARAPAGGRRRVGRGRGDRDGRRAGGRTRV